MDSGVVCLRYRQYACNLSGKWKSNSERSCGSALRLRFSPLRKLPQCSRRGIRHILRSRYRQALSLNRSPHADGDPEGGGDRDQVSRAENRQKTLANQVRQRGKDRQQQEHGNCPPAQLAQKIGVRPLPPGSLREPVEVQGEERSE